LIDLYDHVLRINADDPVTFFEFTTAMTFKAFHDTPADIVLLETGMGGRLDCSNVVPNPALTIITKISYDHVQFLGDTLPKIAAEKAGIMKSNVPCIIGPQMYPDDVLPVFEQTAISHHAPLYIAGRDFPAQTALTPNLVGSHQLENAATAQAAAQELNKVGFKIDQASIDWGITHAEWPGRMQRIIDGPVAAELSEGWELWFDGAHNDSGAMALADQLKAWKKEDLSRPIHLVVGMSAHKEPEEFFKAVLGTYDTLTLVDLPTGQKPQTATELQMRIGTHYPTAKNLIDALKTLPKDRPSLVCVAGSLYLYSVLW
ncbi:MAG TPA: bifunctional folylpolyglutamate synthase/dihydrofolate synthase, partial [Alphaproteobacteria bacterium]